MTTTPIDTSEMATIHTFFRREFRLAGGVVRGVAAGDVAARAGGRRPPGVRRPVPAPPPHRRGRAGLADPARARARRARPDRDAHGVAARARRRPARARSRRCARLAGGRRHATRDRLADTLDTLYAHLAEHLDAEEDRLLPIAARALTLEEWQAIGERARRQTPRSELFLTFGMFQHDGDPEVAGPDAGRGAAARAPARARRWPDAPSAGTRCASTAPRRPDRRRTAARRRVAAGRRASSVLATQSGRPSSSCALRARARCSRAASRSPAAAASSPSAWWLLPRNATGTRAGEQVGVRA